MNVVVDLGRVVALGKRGLGGVCVIRRSWSLNFVEKMGGHGLLVVDSFDVFESGVGFDEILGKNKVKLALKFNFTAR